MSSTTLLDNYPFIGKLRHYLYFNTRQILHHKTTQLGTKFKYSFQFALWNRFSGDIFQEPAGGPAQAVFRYRRTQYTAYHAISWVTAVILLW